MTTRLNIPNSNVATFVKVCENMHIDYVQINVDDVSTLYEVTTKHHSTLFHIGSAYGLDVANNIINETYGK